jgi:hypothetical protein
MHPAIPDPHPCGQDETMRPADDASIPTVPAGEGRGGVREKQDGGRPRQVGDSAFRRIVHKAWDPLPSPWHQARPSGQRLGRELVCHAEVTASHCAAGPGHGPYPGPLPLRDGVNAFYDCCKNPKNAPMPAW